MRQECTNLPGTRTEYEIDMRISLSEKSVEGFPFVFASRPISEDDLMELGKFIRESCESRKVGGAILDCQAIEGALSPGALHTATPAYTEEAGRSLKVAYINPPPHWKPGDDQFGRDLAYNRGGLLELFDTATDAAQWLRDT
jgi:hypothetical protein